MKAIQLHARGGPEQLVYEDAPKPALLEGDALVKVLAASITRDELTWPETYTDEKGNSRLPTIPAHEVCGVVESLAPGASGVLEGETVYGLTSFVRNGAAADYIAVRAADLAAKPLTLDPTQAAAVPLAALTAWQALFDHAGLKKGQKILIHGAAGGVGTFAVQLAYWHGAQVLATASAESIQLVKKLGAHQVIDYKTQRFEQEVSDVDVVLDCIGGETQDRSWQVIKRDGVLVSIAGQSIQQPAAYPDVKGIFFIVKQSRLQLMEIASIIDQGFVRPIIADIFPIQRAREAFERTEQPGKQGKIVLLVK